MSDLNPKQAVFERFAAVAKALGHAGRLDMLEVMAQGERSVEALATASGLSVANASQHLQHLRRIGIIQARKSGSHVLYRLSSDDVVDLLTALRRTAERHVAELDRIVQGYFRERDGLEAVSRGELVQRMRDGLVTLIDVRPSEEFSAGHVAGAANIPLKDLKARLKEVGSTGREVVAYCRGPYCVLAFEAVALLRENGIGARRMEDGYPEWRAAGLPTETSAS